MNLIETSIQFMHHFAGSDSPGEGIDKYWNSVLPETKVIIENEFFLTLHHHYINELVKREAAQMAQTLALCDVSDLADATLVLHCLVRGMWLGIAYDAKFQAFVNGNVSGTIHSVRGIMRKPDPIIWRKSSYLWLPVSVGIDRQIFLALVEQGKQYRFAQRCWTELTRRHLPGNDVEKYTFVLLTDSEEFRQHRNEGIQWLSRESRRIAPDVGEDAMQDWLEKLSALPLHMQIQKVRATRKAIRQGAMDIVNKGGECKPISLEKEKVFVNSIADDSTEVTSEEMIDKEFLQLLSANRAKIEKILHRNTKIGKRRFKVLQLLAHEPDLTSVEIAVRLKASEQTIGRDREKIKESRSLILEAIYS